ncbi:SH3 domain-binding protein 2-like isoform X2 [Gigantopelta aegis]|uniref:SH3 domain-binding protein 2-like isoform X2 n=1 Tax=Gigantopelta aegis TaxID=1735272 RepID=UPI001B88A544|nr:SH3 domain-binding protein 2-like isoform X2 [Gigantopelta aegis]
MSTFHGSIRVIISEINQFFNDTLRHEKLSPKAIQKKESIQKLINELQSSYPQIAPNDQSDRVFLHDVRIADIAAKDLYNVAKAGFLEKRRKKELRLRSSYQRRYCIIEYGVFYYYINTTDKKQAGAFSLDGYKFHKAPYLPTDANKGEVSFELTGANRRTYQFLAESKTDMDEWRVAVEKFSGLNSKSKSTGNEPAPRPDQPIGVPDSEELPYEFEDENSSEFDKETQSDDSASYEVPHTQRKTVGKQDSNDETSRTDQQAPPNHHDNHQDRNASPSTPNSTCRSPPSDQDRHPPRNPVHPPPPPRQQQQRRQQQHRQQQQQRPAPGSTATVPAAKPREKMHPSVPAPKPPTKSAPKTKAPPPIAPKYGRQPPNTNVNGRHESDIYDDVDNRVAPDSYTEDNYEDVRTANPNEQAKNNFEQYSEEQFCTAAEKEAPIGRYPQEHTPLAESQSSLYANADSDLH